MKYLIDKSVLVAEIEKRRKEAELNCGGYKSYEEHRCDSCTVDFYDEFLEIINNLEVKEVNVSNISENLAVAHEYLGYISTGNLAHNKPLINARLKWAIRGLFDAGLFELTHDKKYRMESLGLKAEQKGE